MTEPEKANWGNRIILLIFGALAIVTIVGTIWSTTAEWGAGETAGPMAIGDGPQANPGDAPDGSAL